MIKKTALILLAVTIFAACSRTEQATTMPDQVAAVVTDPVLMPSPMPTNTETAVTTPSRTPNPTNTPLPTATATITPTPTPTAAVWVGAGTPVVDSAVIGVENVGQITELARWGRGVIRDIDLSADGRWLAVAAGSGAYIHDLQDFEAEPVAFEMAGDVTAVSISPTGDKIAIVTDEKSVQLWQVEPQKRLYTDIDDRVVELVQTQFSPDGQILAVVKRKDEFSSVELWDNVDGEIIVSYRPEYQFRPRVKFSPNSSYVAVWSQNDDTIEIYDWREDRLVDTNQAILQSDIGAMVGDLEFLTEDELRLLVIEIADSTFVTGRIELQNARDNTVIFTADRIDNLAEPIKYVCNESVVFWDPPDPPVPYRMGISPEQQIAALYYTGPGFSVTDGGQGLLRFHQLNGQLLYSVADRIVDFEFSPDGQTWVAALQDGRLQIRQLSDGFVLESIDAYESPVLDVRISPNDEWIGVIYADEVKIYHREDGINHLRYPVSEIAFSPDNETFALAYDDGLIEIRNLTDGSLINSKVGHDDLVSALSYLPTGELVSAGFDCNLLVWQTPELTQINSFENVIVEGTFSGEPVPVRIQEFLPMPDGESVIGQLYGGDFGVWSLPEGRLIREPSSDYQEYSGILAVSFDGKTMAVPRHRIPESWDDTLAFVETDANEAGFSPNASMLIGDPWLYAEDYEFGGMLNVWQVEPKQLLNTIGEETEAVTAVSFTKDGQLIISTALDGIVRLWGIP